MILPSNNIIIPIGMKMESGGSGNAKKSSVIRPYNSYNIFFALERVRFIETKKKCLGAGSPIPSNGNQNPSSSGIAFNGYDHLDLPPLPPRFEHLKSIMPHNWYVPGKNKQSKRKHEKTHGGELYKKDNASLLSF